MSNLENDTAEIHPTELLLPWYVNGKLSDDEKSEVENWLLENPEAQAHLSRVEEEHIVAIESAEEIPMPRAAAVNDLLSQITDARTQKTGASLSERFFELLSPRWAMAGAAAIALLIVAQGTTIGMLVSGPPTSTFETASGPTEASISGVTALVAFQPTTALADVSAYLEENSLTIIGGPKPGGIYQIAAADSDAGRLALRTLSEDKELVSFFSSQAEQ